MGRKVSGYARRALTIRHWACPLSFHLFAGGQVACTPTCADLRGSLCIVKRIIKRPWTCSIYLLLCPPVLLRKKSDTANGGLHCVFPFKMRVPFAEAKIIGHENERICAARFCIVKYMTIQHWACPISLLLFAGGQVACARSCADLRGSLCIVKRITKRPWTCSISLLLCPPSPAPQEIGHRQWRFALCFSIQDACAICRSEGNWARK